MTRSDLEMLASELKQVKPVKEVDPDIEDYGELEAFELNYQNDLRMWKRCVMAAWRAGNATNPRFRGDQFLEACDYPAEV